MVAHLDDEVMKEFVAFARYVVSGSPETGHIYKAMQEADKDKEKGGFKGRLPKFSIANEAAAWEHIKKAADAALKKYPTSL